MIGILELVAMAFSAAGVLACIFVEIRPIDKMMILFILRFPPNTALANNQFTKSGASFFYMEYDTIFFPAQWMARNIHSN
jgi:hypothetical protein